MSESQSVSGPGVHSRGEDALGMTVAAIHARLDRTVGDTTYFRTGVLLNEDAIDDVAGQKVAAALRTLEARDGYGGVDVAESNPDSNRLRWTARRVDGEVKSLCTACLAEACGVSEATVQRATGNSFKRSEGA